MFDAEQVWKVQNCIIKLGGFDVSHGSKYQGYQQYVIDPRLELSHVSGHPK